MATTKLSIANLIERAPEPPVRGLFTSTLAKSSKVKAIHSATIQRENANDIIFVHKSHITIKHLVTAYEPVIAYDDEQTEPYLGCLQQVLAKSDFDSSIMASRILTLDSPEIDWRAKTAPPSSYTLNSRSKDPIFSRATSHSSEAETDEAISDGTPVNADPYSLPPQMLVLTLRRGKRDSVAILFLHPDRPEFVSYQRSLPPPLVPFANEEVQDSLRLGSHLAVEPQGRAIAVGAHAERFMLYRIKPKRDWFKDQSSSTDGSDGQFQPFAEERQVAVNGVIVHLVFLQPPKSDNDTVIILLLVSHRDKNNRDQAQLQRWDWDTNQTLEKGLCQVWFTMPINPKLKEPHLLIPYTSQTGFVLLNDQHIGRFTDIMSGSPKASVGPLHVNGVTERQSAYSGISKGPLNWMAWAKPTRRPDFHEEWEHFYICREDGKVLYIESRRGSDFDVTNDLDLESPADTAFAIIPGVDGDRELVVTSTGFFTVKPQSELTPRQHFPDWSTVHNFTFASSPPRIAICSLSDEMSYLHTALEATTWGTATGQYHPRDQWILPIEDSSSVPVEDSSSAFLLSSFPTETQCQHVSFGEDRRKTSVAAALEEFFDLSSPTLVAGKLQNGVFVQVTATSIRATLGKGKEQILRFEAEAIAACLERPFNRIIVLLRGTQKAVLRLASVTVDNGSLHIDTASDPHNRKPFQDDEIENVTCMATTTAEDGTSFVAISTWDRVSVAEVSPTGHTVATQNLECGPCESIVMQSRTEGTLATLGLRDGIVRFVDFELRTGRILSDCQIRIGDGIVRLLGIPGAVLALRDGKIDRLERGKLSDQVFRRRVSLSRETKHVQIEAMSMMPSQEGKKPMIVFLSKTKALFTSLGEARTFCDKQRLFELGHSPCNITAVRNYDDGLAVVYRHTQFPSREQSLAARGQSPTTHGTRHKYEGIGFVRKRTDRLGEANTSSMLKSGAEFKDMFEWCPEIEGSTYKLLVGCASTPKKGNQPSTPPEQQGRILLYKLAGESEEPLKLMCCHKLRRDHPIDAVAPYDKDSLIIASNMKLEVITLRKLDGGKKLQWSEKTLEIRGLVPKIDALHVGQSSEGRKLVYATGQKQLAVYEVGTGRRWESESHDKMTQIRVSTSTSTSVALSLGLDGVLGFWFDDRALAESGTGRFRKDGMHSLFEANLQGTLIHMMPRDDDWFIANKAPGEFHQFKLLSEDEWKLLRYIQNLAEQDRGICPFAWQDGLDPNNRPKQPLDPSLIRHRNVNRGLMHINGDVLRRLTVDDLHDTLMANAQGQDHELKLSTKEGRIAFLKELAGKVSADLQGEDMFDLLLEWIRTLWEPRL